MNLEIHRKKKSLNQSSIFIKVDYEDKKAKIRKKLFNYSKLKK